MSIYKNNISVLLKKLNIYTVRIITQSLTISTGFKYHTLNFHKQVTMSFSISHCMQLFFGTDSNAMHFTFNIKYMQQTLHKQTVNGSLSLIHI